ncbi:MAG: helix-turn-helix domain-containing protein [Candidatus Andersenbacteria bacterium]|nr:helix-turn-helix domain-containing protein [Candidatus Andersenbacteria bacterium]MBI3251098.1 helix-turn-helix domain-containing protein [Candidatus Andersenbacteria bacterium]
MNKEDQYLTLEQVAKKLQVARITVYRMVRRKQLPAVKLGKAWRVSSKKLAELFDP